MSRNQRHFDLGSDRHGFRFGEAWVQRIHRDRRTGAATLGIDTPHRRVQVSISPTGQTVSVWIDGKKLR